MATRLYFWVRVLTIAMAVYLVVGFLVGLALPLVQLPLWAVDMLSRCFEGVFVTVFGQW